MNETSNFLIGCFDPERYFDFCSAPQNSRSPVDFSVTHDKANPLPRIGEVLFRDNRMMAGRRFNGDERFVDNVFGLSSEQIQVRKFVVYKSK